MTPPRVILFHVSSASGLFLVDAGGLSVPAVHDLPPRGCVCPGRVSEQGGSPEVPAAAARRRVRHDPKPGKFTRVS